jgi:hypothetical protein
MQEDAGQSGEVLRESAGTGVGRAGPAVEAGRAEQTYPVCEIFFWRYAIPLFTVTYEPYTKGDKVMEGKRVSAEELKQAMAADFERLAAQVAEVMNAAQDGRIIADTEEPVRQANAVFREQMYAKAIRLLQNKQEAFSPSARRAAEQRPAADDASDGERASVRA